MSLYMQDQILNQVVDLMLFGICGICAALKAIVPSKWLRMDNNYINYLFKENV